MKGILTMLKDFVNVSSTHQYLYLGVTDNYAKDGGSGKV